MRASTEKRCQGRFCVCDSEEPRSNTCTLLHNQPPQLGGLKQHPLTTSPQFCRVETQHNTAAFSAQGLAGRRLHTWSLGSSSPFISGTGIIQSLAAVGLRSPFPSAWPALPTARQLILQGQQKGICCCSSLLRAHWVESGISSIIFLFIN